MIVSMAASIDGDLASRPGVGPISSSYCDFRLYHKVM